MNVGYFNFPLPSDTLEEKCNKFCKKLNKSMLWYFNISLTKKF